QQCTLELQSQTNPELPFIILSALPVRTGNYAETVQCAHRSIRVQLKVRDVRAGIRKVRRVGDIQRFEAKLKGRLIPETERAENTRVQICITRSTKAVVSSRPEA